jgi:hypothetical protein
MKRTAIRKVSAKQRTRETERKKVVQELIEEVGYVCEVCVDKGLEGYEPYFIPIVGHEIVFRSEGIKSCKMDRTNIILLGYTHHEQAQNRQLSAGYLQNIVDKRNLGSVSI